MLFSSLQKHLHPPVLITALTFLCFLSSLRNEFVYDDSWTIIHNSAIRSTQVIPALFTGEAVTQRVPDAWRPLMVMSHILDYRLFKLRPAGYHLHSLLWHLACVWLVWSLFRRLHPREPLLAWLTSALFAVLPIHVEVVSAINFREDLMATAFSLAALVIALHRANRETTAMSHSHVRGPGLWMLAGAVCLLLGLLAKESAAVTIALYPLLAIVSSEHISFELNAVKKQFQDVFPYTITLALTFGIYVAWRFGTSGTLNPYPAIGAELPLAHLSWIDRLPTIGESVFRSIFQQLIPIHLSPDYPETPASWNSLWGIVAVPALAVLLLALSVLRWKRNSETRIAALISIGWFLIAWLPVSGIAPLPHLRADRYAYFPSIGTCLLLSFALMRIRAIRLRTIVITTVFASYVGVTLFQQQIWRNEHSLWQRATAVNPKSAHAWTGLARALRSRDLVQAENAAKNALTLNPKLSIAHLVLANIYLRKNAFDDAIVHYQTAAETHPRYPAHVYSSWGWAEFRRKNNDQAEQLLKKAIEADPHFAQAHANLAFIYGSQHRDQEAEQHLETAIRFAPERATRYRNKFNQFRNRFRSGIKDISEDE